MSSLNQTQQAINQFRASEETSYIFACQAAVPLLLTPDLLYQLWNNFKTYQYSFDTKTTYKIPHFAVSDLLLSSLCREVGVGLYEMIKEIRADLLNQLVMNLGEKRKNTIALFLKDYALLEYRFAKRRYLKDIHILTAQSFLDPAAMERKIIDLINQSEEDRDKIKYLLLHRNLMPVGYDSDLGRISKEIGTADNSRELSPVLIAAETIDGPGVFNVNIDLPNLLKGKIFKVRSDTTLAPRELSKAQKLINECLDKRSDFLNLSNCQLLDADWIDGGSLDVLLSKCDQHLTTFILTGEHSLTKLPQAVFNLSKLENLHFGGTEYKKMEVNEVSAKLTELTALQFLNLSYNSLTDIPSGFSHLKNLVLLNLEGNNLTGLRKEIGDLSKLKELNIGKNQITLLPDSLRQLTGLRELNIDDNPIVGKLKEEVTGLTPREIFSLIFPSAHLHSDSTPSPTNMYSIGGQAIEGDAFEAIKDIPSNRTLMAIQLTSVPAYRAEVVTDLTRLSDVFDHYKPSIQARLLDADNNIKDEHLVFRYLQDFSAKGLISLSPFLKNQQWRLDQFKRILKQLQSNKLFIQLFINVDARQWMLSAVTALGQILQANAQHEKTQDQPNESDGGRSMISLEKNLENAIDSLSKFGGYDIIESTIEGSQNLNPARKARRGIFLEESEKAEERQQLLDSLLYWQRVLELDTTIREAIEVYEVRRNDLEERVNSNVKSVIQQVKELESAYRTVDLFYSNAETGKIKNISFVNAGLAQLKDLENDFVFKVIAEELTANFDRLDLRGNYGLLVLPGYLGTAATVHKWAKMAYENKVMMITDFENFENPSDLIDAFSHADLVTGDFYMSNAVMTCNWLVGREQYEQFDETEPLFIPPSGALAGKIYSTMSSQITAGRKNGGMNVVDGVRFDLKKSEIAALEKIGLVPMVKEYGKVMAFSAKTLFNGDNLAMQTYSVVRVFDYIIKVIMDFLNRRAFEKFNVNSRREQQSLIIRFLDSITGPNKLIEKYRIQRFEKDSGQKDRIYLDIHVTPFFPAKTFLIKMSGQKGDDSNEWSSDYETVR